MLFIRRLRATFILVTHVLKLGLYFSLFGSYSCVYMAYHLVQNNISSYLQLLAVLRYKQNNEHNNLNKLETCRNNQLIDDHISIYLNSLKHNNQFKLWDLSSSTCAKDVRHGFAQERVTFWMQSVFALDLDTLRDITAFCLGIKGA